MYELMAKWRQGDKKKKKKNAVDFRPVIESNFEAIDALYSRINHKPIR